MPVKRLKDFLDAHDVTYTSLTHSRAYTAQEIADHHSTTSLVWCEKWRVATGPVQSSHDG